MSSNPNAQNHEPQCLPTVPFVFLLRLVEAQLSPKFTVTCYAQAKSQLEVQPGGQRRRTLDQQSGLSTTPMRGSLPEVHFGAQEDALGF